MLYTIYLYSLILCATGTTVSLLFLGGFKGASLLRVLWGYSVGLIPVFNTIISVVMVLLILESIKLPGGK